MGLQKLLEFLDSLSHEELREGEVREFCISDFSIKLERDIASQYNLAVEFPFEIKNFSGLMAKLNYDIFVMQEDKIYYAQNHFTPNLPNTIVQNYQGNKLIFKDARAVTAQQIATYAKNILKKLDTEHVTSELG